MMFLINVFDCWCRIVGLDKRGCFVSLPIVSLLLVLLGVLSRLTLRIFGGPNCPSR